MKFLFFLLLLPFLGISQKKEGYFALTVGANFKANTDPAFGAYLSGNGQIGPGFFIGAEIGVVKLPDLDGVYLPLLSRFTLIPRKDPKKLSPMILLQPGYGIYEKTVSNIKTEGGFCFYGGAGVAFPGQGKGRGYLTVGYSLFGLNVNDVGANLEMIGIRAGIMIK